MRSSALAFALTLLSLTGCAVGPKYQAPDADAAPTAFYGPADKSPTAPSPIAWWTAFHDATLTALIEEAAAANPNLQSAAARVREARARRNAITGSFDPSLNFGAGVSRQSLSLNGLTPVSDGSNPNLPLPGRDNTIYKAGFDAAWEIDLFGGNHHATEQANAQAEAVTFSYADALDSLLAETARAYLDARLAARRLELLDANLELRQRTLRIVQDRFDAGTVTELEVARAHRAVLELNAQRPILLTARDGAIIALSLATTLPPEEIATRLAATAAAGLPPDPGSPTVGLPSDLLRRRPDVRQAERLLAAATAGLGVATADLYPKFSLVGTLGLDSLERGNFAESASRYWSFGPKLTLPLLHGGALRSTVQARQANLDATWADYQATVLRALRDVELAVLRQRHTTAQLAARREVLDTAELAHRLARDQFDAGVLPLDDLLAIEADLNLARDSIVQLEAALAQQSVNLAHALGGGWQALPTGEPAE